MAKNDVCTKKIAQQHQHKDILSYNFFNLLIIMCYYLCSFYSHNTALIWLSTKVPKLDWTMIETFFFFFFSNSTIRDEIKYEGGEMH